MSERRFTRGEFIGRDGWFTQRKPLSIVQAPNIQRNESNHQEGGPTLPEGWTEYNPDNGENMPKKDVIKYKVPLEFLPNFENLQLPNPTSLQTMTGKRFLDGLYPSLAKYYKEDDISKPLEVYSYTDERGKIITKTVNIIWATADAEHNTGDVGRTHKRVVGNKVEYDIILLLNPPVSKNFTSIVEYRRWLESVYAHEKIHVYQMARRHEKLIKSNPNATDADIRSELNSNLIQDEVEAYWAMLTYGKIRNLEWFNGDTSPFGSDLTVPFNILQTKGIDPLDYGIKSNDQIKYEALWQFIIYTHAKYDNLVYQSAHGHPEYISMMEQCYKEGLIPESTFMEYLEQVDPDRYRRYRQMEELKARVTSSLLSPEVKFVAGLVALTAASLIGFRMLRGK